MFGRRELNPAKILQLHGDQWRQGEALRVTPRRRWDADPSAKRMVLRRRELNEFALSPMRWGLVPESHQQEEETARPLIAVRAETIAEHVEWRRLLNARRCVVPTDQFFEWMRTGGVKRREYAFRLKSRRPMMIAALWNRTPTANGKMTETFAYISCTANRLVSLIHDRMPVILDDAAMTAWFNPNTSLEALLDLLRPLEASLLDLHAVGEPARAKPYQPSLFAQRAA